MTESSVRNGICMSASPAATCSARPRRRRLLLRRGRNWIVRTFDTYDVFVCRSPYEYAYRLSIRVHFHSGHGEDRVTGVQNTTTNGHCTFESSLAAIRHIQASTINEQFEISNLIVLSFSPEPLYQYHSGAWGLLQTGSTQEVWRFINRSAMRVKQKVTFTCTHC